MTETESPFNDSWPPPWFGAIQSDRPDTAARTEEILRAGFGTGAAGSTEESDG